MMRRGLLFMMLVAALVTACRKEVNQEEVMAKAAQQYYSYLLNGNYEAWVDGFARNDSIRSHYRSQLVDNAKMFMALQKTEHGGIKSATVKRAELDTLRRIANVFFTLTYGDGTHEQTVMPMIHKDGLWYMR